MEDVLPKTVKIVLVIILLLAAAIGYLAMKRYQFDFFMNEQWALLSSYKAQEVFSLDMVEGLPEPARRYFLHAIEPGTPLARSVEITMTGTIALKPGGEKMPFSARQIIAMQGALIWHAQAGHGIMKVSGYDFYVPTTGGMRWWLWDILPVVNARDADTIRSAAGRVALETSIMLPSALLPQYGAAWEGVDENTARVRTAIDDEHLAIDITVAPDGSLERVRMMRWDARGLSGTPEYVPWVGTGFTREETFQGYTIPTHVSAVAKAGTSQENPFFEAEFLSADFH